MSKTTVLLVDDHTIVREGLRLLLEAEPDIAVVGEAKDGRQGLQLARELKPDIVIMDIAMPNLNGLEATRQIARDLPASRLVILSSYNDDEYVHQVIHSGASGYLLKQTAALDLIKAVREVKNGHAFFSPSISKRLAERYREASLQGRALDDKIDALTSRESEVLQLIAEGRPNKQIAAELCISIKTVEKHRQQMMNKLNIHDIAGLTRYAISKGVVETSARAQV